MTALVRFIVTVAVALVTLTRADLSPLPAWIERYFLLDSGSKSFQAAVKAYHHFNNPIFRVACWILTEDPKRRRQLLAQGGLTGVATAAQLCGKVTFDDEAEKEDVASEAKDDDEADTATAGKEAVSTKDTRVTVRTRRRSGLGVLRWRLAIMLHRFPQLRYHRAHYLARKKGKKWNLWRQGMAASDSAETRTRKRTPRIIRKRTRTKKGTSTKKDTGVKKRTRIKTDTSNKTRFNAKTDTGSKKRTRAKTGTGTKKRVRPKKTLVKANSNPNIAIAFE